MYRAALAQANTLSENEANTPKKSRTKLRDEENQVLVIFCALWYQATQEFSIPLNIRLVSQ